MRMTKCQNRCDLFGCVFISWAVCAHPYSCHPSVSFKQNSLQDIFKKELAFPASSSFICAYPEAPNPCLNVRGIGTIGLPLHARDAEAIKTRASQAPFGKATETMVDKSVRHYAPETS